MISQGSTDGLNKSVGQDSMRRRVDSFRFHITELPRTLTLCVDTQVCNTVACAMKLCCEWELAWG